MPFGVALSLRTGIPLVYSRGAGEAPVFDLVGAYDIGHPALLLTNSVGWRGSPDTLVKRARRVGLEVHTLLPIIEASALIAAPDELPMLPLLRLDEIVRELAQEGQLCQRVMRRLVLQSAGITKRAIINGL